MLFSRGIERGCEQSEDEDEPQVSKRVPVSSKILETMS